MNLAVRISRALRIAPHMPPEVLDAYLQPVWSGEQALQVVERVNPEEKKESIAEGFDVPHN